jgi:hypothetical protein
VRRKEPRRIMGMNRARAELSSVLQALEAEAEGLDRETFRTRMRPSLELETIALRLEIWRLRAEIAR